MAGRQMFGWCRGPVEGRSPAGVLPAAATAAAVAAAAAVATATATATAVFGVADC
ncbi:hypothetical protein ABZ312_12830 [Streptomyces sp. NPDC006207]